MLGLDSPTSLGVIRSLGRQGIPVVGIAEKGFSLSSASKFCKGEEIVGGESELLDLLLECGEAAAPNRLVIFAENDTYLLFLEHYQEQLAQFFLWWGPGKYTFAEIIDKRSMLSIAKDAGLDIPVTFYSDNHSVKEIGTELVYPCIVKPCFTQNNYRTKCEIATNQEGLSRILQGKRFESGYMVQEIIQGPVENLYFYMGYWNKKSAPIAAICGYKLRQLPGDFGIGTLAVTKENSEITQLAEMFLRHIGFHGLADIEFKYNPRTGKYVFIEINPRPCGLISLSATAGLDMVYLAYTDLTIAGATQGCHRHQPDGLLWMSIWDDLLSCVKYPLAQKKMAIWDWIRNIIRCNSYAVFSISDPKPFFWAIYLKIRHWCQSDR